jgi:glycosyltransferase involved in cell wall biosynthesis
MIAAAPATGGKPRALIVAARFPGFSAPMAGHRICAAHVANVAATYSVDLFVVCRDIEDFSEIERMRELCARVKVVTISKVDGLKGLLTNPLLPLPAAIRATGSIMRALVAFADANYDLAHFEWTETAHFAPSIRAARKQILCHDILSELFGRRTSGGLKQRIFWSLQARNARRYEETRLPSMDRVFVLSQTDGLDLADMGVAPDCISVIAPEFYKCDPAPKPWDNAPRKLLLWGAFSREENREAADILLRDIMPKLEGHNIELLIAGSESDKHYASSANVRVLGRVADPAIVFAEAHLGVFPLHHGSGLKIKVLEALYAGLPVITTSVGKEGYECGDEEGLFLAERPDEFVSAITRLTADRTAYDRAAGASASWARSFIASSNSGVV